MSDKENNMSYLIGAFMGDGCCYVGKNSYQFSITSEDYDLCSLCQEICSSIFGKIGRIKPVYKKEKLSYYQLIICSKEIVSFLNDITQNKTIVPKYVYKNEETIKSFIRGLMDTDGWISRVDAGDGYTRFRIGFKNISKWTIDLHDMIEKLGVKVGIVSLRKNKRYEKDTKDSYYFSVNTLDYCSDIGFCIKRKQDITKEFLGWYGQKHGKKNT